MSANARHSKATPRWGTPANWCTMARIALGGDIDLDPMSEPAFNATVRAARIFTEQDDGLKQQWLSPRLFLNPAGGLVVEAWRKLCAEYEAGRARRAVWIGFSAEQLCILADERWHPQDFSLLLARRRISFVRHDGVTGAPSHANYVVGLGISAERFEMAFRGQGRIGHGMFSLKWDRAEAV